MYTWSTIAAVLVLAVTPATTLPADDSVPALPAAFQAHCIKCHGQEKQVEGETNLLEIKSDADLEARPQLLEKLIQVLRNGDMPPQDAPPLSANQRQQIVSSLHAMLQRVRASQPFIPTPIRRMNRFQYNNAVVDLLELDRDLFRLNERLLRRRVDYFQPATGKMPPEVKVSSRPLSKDIDNQRPEGFRGVAAFPQDKRAEHGFDNRADHLTMSPLLMESFLRLSQTIVESADLNPKECRSWDQLFAPPGKPVRTPVEGRYEAEANGAIKIVSTPSGKVAPLEMKGFGSDWSGNAQLLWTCPKEGLELTLSFQVGAAGTGIRFGLTKAPDYGMFAFYLDDQKIGASVDLYDPQVIHSTQDVVVQITPGAHTLKIQCVGKQAASKNYFFGLDYAQVTGLASPVKTEPTETSEIDAVRIRLKSLLRRAFRRPVDPRILQRFTQFAQRQLDSGAPFEQTMRTLVGAILGMPDFLYFYESGARQKTPVTNPGRQPVTDFELAARLAQFFWSSIPDTPLLDLAAAGRLSDPEILSAQIDRMMNDSRSSRFCDNFPAQWLQLDRLITSIPDPQKFPYFYYFGYRTSMHMLSEPLLLFETVYVENLSVMDLLVPDFTWESNMLRANYSGHSKGDHQVNIQSFKRVPLEDARRGGVITNAAVLTMTSTPVRTQPITRGAWINAVIFNDPPEPPPADVPVLPEVDNEKLAKLTIRERLAEHRTRADCAGCHEQIDPLGFALENFGPTGVWRDTYENGRQVDASGVLFNRHAFKTILEFKKLLVKEKERFLRGFVSHLLSYALSRDLGIADASTLDDLTAQAVQGQDQMRTLLKAIAMSEPFLHKSTLAPAAPRRKANQPAPPTKDNASDDRAP